ncbi:MAG TPA: MgtC/SapB family protein [Armatimonadetes bacterium]|jgi:putative Mg2+ transporter-C (MgtC) family protein|nr:MgtC/SapB family protein [Armatimonadota bacterium]
MGEVLAALTPWGDVLGRLLVAALCGGIIGFERESADRPAGFRTHLLVCVGSAVYMLTSTMVAGKTHDPGRIAAQVASGIGFLGAGTILKQGSMVRGLTTAASLWVVAGIGLAAGFGRGGAGIAFLGTLIVLISLNTLKILERRLDRAHRCDVRLTIARPRERMEWLRDVLEAHEIKVRGLSITENGDGIGKITIAGRAATRARLEEAVRQLAQHKAVSGVDWEFQ